VELTDGAGQRHRDSEEVSDLHRLPDEATEGFGPCGVDDQHG
jgi:hypothetical protein